MIFVWRSRGVDTYLVPVADFSEKVLYLQGMEYALLFLLHHQGQWPIEYAAVQAGRGYPAKHPRAMAGQKWRLKRGIR